MDLEFLEIAVAFLIPILFVAAGIVLLRKVIRYSLKTIVARRPTEPEQAKESAARRKARRTGAFQTALKPADGLRTDIDISDYLLWVAIMKSEKGNVREYVFAGAPLAILWSDTAEEHEWTVVANKNIWVSVFGD